MGNETLTTDPVDPLHDLIGLTLLPTTIRASTDSIDPKDLESVHNFMKSLEMKSPEKALEEARAIVDNGAELFNTKFKSFLQSMGIDGDLAKKGKEKVQERRPGLGRKRPQFSLKQITSQPPVSLGPSLDIDQLSDPVELFAAADKLEDAEREIKRQKGSSLHDQDVNKPLTNARSRRPGILGKSVRGKHKFSFTQSENDDSFIVSQETPEHDILAEHNSQLPQEPPGLSDELQEADYTGSIKNTENRINGILDELLSSTGEDLDGEMALSKLQESLQIKPIELSSLCIPDFPMTGKTDGKAVGERIQKPKKFSLEIQNLVKRATEGSPSTYRQHEESPADNLASPTPPKSPFASLSLLKKRILQSNPLRDPFSPLNIDLQSEDPPGLSMKMNAQCVSENVVPTESHGETENLANTNIVPLRSSDFSHEHLMEKNSGRDREKSGPSESQFGMEQQNCYGDVDDNTDTSLNMRNMDFHHESDGLDKVKDVSVVDSVLKDQQTLESESYTNCQKMQDGEVLAETLPSLQAHGKADDTANCSIETTVEDFGSTEIDRQVDNMAPETADSAEKAHPVEDPAKDLNSDQLNSVAVEVHSTEDRSKLPERSPLHHAQAKDKQQKAKRRAGRRRERKALSSRPSLADKLNSVAVEVHSTEDTSKLPETSPQHDAQAKDRQKAKGCAVGMRERKALSSRPSLAAAGTSFEDGVRRSKRMKTRRLEFWRGERLLFGRVNESMKLVGVKYISPAKGSLKVKSYISDDYKDVVELAARY